MVGNDKLSANHWRAMPNWEMDELSADEAVAIIAARTADLFEGRVVGDFDRFGPVQPTQSRRGVNRLRAFVPDPDADLAYLESEYHAGIVREGDSLYLERHFPFPYTNPRDEVYLLNLVKPEQSVAFRLRQGLPLEEIPLPQARNNTIHVLGRFVRTYLTDDYASNAVWDTQMFAHPDL
jgi:hypothetical protein